MAGTPGRSQAKKRETEYLPSVGNGSTESYRGVRSQFNLFASFPLRAAVRPVRRDNSDGTVDPAERPACRCYPATGVLSNMPSR